MTLDLPVAGVFEVREGRSRTVYSLDVAAGPASRSAERYPRSGSTPPRRCCAVPTARLRCQ
jgi:hypothetical protein